MMGRPQTIQIPLRKFLYEGRIPPSSPPFPSLDMESLVIATDLKGSFESPVPQHPSSSAASDCVLIDAGCVVKSSSPNVEVLDPNVASSSYEAAKKQKKTYELNRHFQDSWAAKLPWAEAVIGSDGRVTHVRCKVCSEAQGREKLLVPKIDSLWKHAGWRKALADMGKIWHGEYYYLVTCQHVKTERVFFAKGGDTVAQQLMLGISKERKLNTIQLKCLFTILSQGRPMCDYVAMEVLLSNLNLP